MKKAIIGLVIFAVVCVAFAGYLINEYGKASLAECRQLHANIDSVANKIESIKSTAKIYEEQISKFKEKPPAEVERFLDQVHNWKKPELATCVKFMDNQPVKEALEQVNQDYNQMNSGLSETMTYVDSQSSSLVEDTAKAWDEIKDSLGKYANKETLDKIKKTLSDGTRKAKIELYKNPDTRKVLDSLKEAKDKLLKGGSKP